MKAIDLFAGCGGMSLGFQKAGYTILAAYDHWDAAVGVYRMNFAHPVYRLDLSKLQNHDIFSQLAPDIIIGGPPCQDFSSAGKRNEKSGRADLTITFAEIIARVRPKWFVMENVERVLKSAVLKQAKQVFKNAGYGLSEPVLNASLCGVPQNRKRYFLIGELQGKDHQLLPYIEKNMSRKPMTVYDYLGNSLGIEHYYRHPRSYQRRAVFSIYEPSPTIRGVNRPIPSTYQTHPGDTAPVSANLRPLTTLERSYIQTFPTDFVFEGTKSDIEQMIGNAVPVNMAKFVAQCILEYIEDQQRDKQEFAVKTAQLPLF